MRIWKIAAIAALGLTAFAADNVAPTKAELEEMYNSAYRAFDAGKFPEALKQLDAIDARQPDLAASKNLRGVILMRQGNYDQAEAALTEAARIDPKFWNARFNMAEIPFLKKDWPEARKRFEQLLSTGGSDLAKEASQLIQYKILLTYLMEGKSNMVDSILAKLELSPDTPAVDYVKAAVALQQKNETEAKDWITAAEKNYSPQLNKLFVESLYEIGWMEKPSGQRRASLPLMTAAERTEKTKAFARSKFEQSQQAFRQRDFATALKLVDEADKVDANQPATLNLRGEILMQQGQFDNAEVAFKKAAKLDPKLRDAQYNLAQIPFKKKEYAKARDRFETLYKRIPGGDKEPGGRAAQVQNLHDPFDGGQREPGAFDDGGIPIHGRHPRALLRTSSMGGTSTIMRKRPRIGPAPPIRFTRRRSTAFLLMLSMMSVGCKDQKAQLLLRSRLMRAMSPRRRRTVVPQ